MFELMAHRGVNALAVFVILPDPHCSCFPRKLPPQGRRSDQHRGNANEPVAGLGGQGSLGVPNKASVYVRSGVKSSGCTPCGQYAGRYACPRRDTLTTASCNGVLAVSKICVASAQVCSGKERREQCSQGHRPIGHPSSTWRHLGGEEWKNVVEVKRRRRRECVCWTETGACRSFLFCFVSPPTEREIA